MELICWWCVHSLPQKPCLHLPVRYDDRRKIFTTIGNFCSWQCAKAYALDMNTAKSGEIQSFLALMRLQALGKHVPLWPAPKRVMLACFGGTLSIDEFRSFGGRVEPPQVYYPFEKKIDPVNQSFKPEVHVTVQGKPSTTKLKQIETADTQNDTLKLKRSKPLARSESKLESALGITRKPK